MLTSVCILLVFFQSNAISFVYSLVLNEPWQIVGAHSRSQASDFINEDLYPASERGRRISLGSPGLHESTLMDNRDPRLDETYGEFPLSSLDVLIDEAERLTDRKLKRFLDLGSGCGRLVLYLALSRENCCIHGIEISNIFHGEALRAVAKAIDMRLVVPSRSNQSPTVRTGGASSMCFELGPASSFPRALHDADLIFCYSTAFPGSGFCQTLSAVLLASEWSELLSRHCKDGCIVITTDKALDASFGWQLLGRVDVPNPEVISSTGFIQVLNRPDTSP